MKSKTKIKEASGLILWLMNKCGFVGWTSNWGSVYIHPKLEGERRDRVVAHELVHIEQIERDGRIGMPLKYLIYMVTGYMEAKRQNLFYWQQWEYRIKARLKYAYKKCPYEVEARERTK